ncbi:MAG: hypothetical protein N2Z60_08305, partial [Elusimicrobiales bacterium]|nr:hypothetical protein [Elusimicrobiales bacterium]
FVDRDLIGETSYYYRISCVDKGDQGNGYFSFPLESLLSDIKFIKGFMGREKIYNDIRISRYILDILFSP